MMKNVICVDESGMNRLNAEEIGKAIMATATVDNDPNLEKMGMTQLRVSDHALAQLVKMFKYSVMIRIAGSDDEILSMVSDAPTVHKALVTVNEKWWVVDNRTGETVVTIE